MLDSENEASRKEIENLNKLLEEKKANEAAVSLKLENLKISHSSVEQKAAFEYPSIISFNLLSACLRQRFQV